MGPRETPHETPAKEGPAAEQAARSPNRRRLAGAFLALAICVVALGAILRFAPTTDLGRGLIERGLDGVKVGRLGRLHIEALRGDPWGDFTIGRLSLADPTGRWLEVQDLAVRWRPADVLARRLHITDMIARRVTVMRRPVLEPPTKPTPQPVSVRIDRAATRVEMAAAFSGTRGLYDVRAAAEVVRSGAIRGRMSAASVLHPGDFLAIHLDALSGKTMDLEAHAREARGGALAGSLGLATDQPFLLDALARGSVRKGNFSLTARVGQSVPAFAQGVWDDRGVSAKGRVHLAASSLLTAYARMAGPEVNFTLEGHKTSKDLQAVSLVAAGDNIALAARGEVDLAHQASGPKGLVIDLRVTDPTRIVAVPQMGPARLAAGLGGDAKHWLLAGRATIDRAAFSGFGLTRVSGPVRLEFIHDELRLSASAQGEGGAGRGLVAALLGARPRASAQLSWPANGRLLIRDLAVEGAGLRITASGSQGLLGDLSFKGAARVTNLAAAHAGARGLLTATWSASQGAGDRPWVVSLNARGAGFAAGFDQLDRLLGAAPSLGLRASYQNGALTVAQSRLQGAAGSLESAGLIAADGALKLSLAWRAQGPFDAGPIQIDGLAKGSGALTGTLANPAADLIADFAVIDLPGAPLRDAHLTLVVAGDPQGIGGHFTLAALSEYGPARAAARFHFLGDGLDLKELAAAGGGIEAAGSVALRAGAPSSADLTLALGPGALLDAGRATGKLRIVDAAGGPRVSLRLTAVDAVSRGGGASFHSLSLTADGPLRRLPFTARAQGAAAGAPWRVAGSGVFSTASGEETLSFTGAGRVRQADLRTLQPAQMRFGPGGVSGRFALAVGAGRADIEASQIAGALKITARTSNVSLGLFDEDLVGKIDATLALAGRGSDLRGDLDAHLSGAGGRGAVSAGSLGGAVKATLAKGSMSIDASLTDGKGLTAKAAVVLPTEASASPFRIAINRKRPIAGRFSIDGQIGPLWDLALGGDNSLAGRLVAAGTLAGTLADPRAVGTAALDNGRFHDAASGLTLRNLVLRAALAGARVDVSEVTGTDGGKGVLTGAGRINLDRDGVSSFRLNLKAFRLIDNDLAQAAASGQISIGRAADGRVKLTGALVIDRAQIAPNPPIPSGVVPMDVVEVNRPYDPNQTDTVQSSRQTPVTLDVGLTAPGGIFVKGRGLNVEFSLNAHVAGTTSAPVLSGVARVVRGDYNFAGQRFQIGERGAVYLGSSPEAIRLDLTATRDNPTLTAVIRIQGTAAKPTIALTSTPVLPQDEVLSQVLFGTSASRLSGLQAAQLASALSGLASGGGFDVIGRLRTFAHLDRLAFGGGPATGTTVSGGKYLTDKLYLELTGGGREGPSAQVEWRVKKHLSVVSRVTTQGTAQLSIRWRKDY